MSDRIDSFTLLGQCEGEIVVRVAVIRENLNRFGKLRDCFV